MRKFLIVFLSCLMVLSLCYFQRGGAVYRALRYGFIYTDGDSSAMTNSFMVFDTTDNKLKLWNEKDSVWYVLQYDSLQSINMWNVVWAESIAVFITQQHTYTETLIFTEIFKDSAHADSLYLTHKHIELLISDSLVAAGAMLASAFEDSLNNDHVITSDWDFQGNLTAGDTLKLNIGSQNYYFIDRSNNLVLQGQSAGTQSGLEIFTKDGDGTDNIVFNIYGLGTPDNITNRERLIIQSMGTTEYSIYTEASGTGEVRPLVLYTEGNTNQLKLFPTGKTSIGDTLVIGVAGLQDYQFIGVSTDSILHLQSQLTGTFGGLALYTKDSDATDNNSIYIYGEGTPGSIANRERLILQYSQSNDQYEIYTEGQGTGDTLALVLWTEGNTDQLKLWTTGKVSTGDTLDVNGTLQLESFTNVFNEIVSKTDTLETIALAAIMGANDSTYASIVARDSAKTAIFDSLTALIGRANAWGATQTISTGDLAITSGDITGGADNVVSINDGLFIADTAYVAGGKFAVIKDQNGSTISSVRNNDAGSSAIADLIIDSNAGNVSIIANSIAKTGTRFGVNRNAKMEITSQQTMLLGASAATDSLILASGNQVAILMDENQNVFIPNGDVTITGATDITGDLTGGADNILSTSDTMKVATLNMNNTPILFQNKAFAFIHTHDSVATTIAAAGTYYNLANSWDTVNGDDPIPLKQFTLSNDTLTYTGSDSIWVNVFISFSVASPISGVTDQFKWQLYRNGVVLGHIIGAERGFRTANLTGSVSMGGKVPLGTGDKLHFRVTSDVNGDTAGHKKGMFDVTEIYRW